MALVESRGPQEVPEDIFLFRPMQHSGTCGPSITEDVAIQYSQHDWGIPFISSKGLNSYFRSIKSKLSIYDAPALLELAIWKSKIIE